MGVPRFRRQTEQRGLRLWPVGLVLVLAFVAAALVAAAVFFAGWDLLGARGLKPERRIDSKTLFDLVKLSFGVVAGAGALVALVVAYRRQRVDEDGALRDATRLHTERFTTAVSQLGDESAAVRLGGVHALAGLADDAPTRDLRQTCIDVLCAYLRLPYTAETELPPDDAAARHAYLALREVRHTVIRLIRDHLRLPSEHPHSWQGHDFDFTGVIFDGGDFDGARFSGGTVNFDGASSPAAGQLRRREVLRAAGLLRRREVLRCRSLLRQRGVLRRHGQLPVRGVLRRHGHLRRRELLRRPGHTSARSSPAAGSSSRARGSPAGSCSAVRSSPAALSTSAKPPVQPLLAWFPQPDRPCQPVCFYLQPGSAETVGLESVMAGGFRWFTATTAGEGAGASDGPAGGEGHAVADDMSKYGHRANRTAEYAATRDGDENRTEAIGQGLAAIAYALLDVAAAIRENTGARR